MNLVQTIHPLLSFGPMYRVAMTMLGGPSARKTHMDNYIRAQAGDRIIDMGCGPCEVLDHLPAVDYIGVDFEQKYIDDAKARFGNRGQFMCLNIADLKQGLFSDADIVLATGVLHHLNDDEALNLFSLAKSFLKPGGRLVTYDGCYLEQGQHPFAKWMLSNDRGKFVRKKDEYVKLAKQHFPAIRAHLHNDLLNVPYTLLIMECSSQ